MQDKPHQNALPAEEQSDQPTQGNRFKVNPDIRYAETLPAEFYRDEEAHQQVLLRAFANSWQFMAHRDDLKDHNWYPVVLLPGSLNEPLLISSSQNNLKCLSNVCTHRGHLLAEKPCTGERIRCRYHGRTFSADGLLHKAPGFEHALNFPRPQDDLPSLAIEELGGMLFTNLQTNPKLSTSFQTFFRPVYDRLSPEYLNALKSEPKLDVDYAVKSHWALYCDNYLEGFHIPYVHPELNKVLDFGSYRTECFEGGSLQIGVAKEGELAFPIRSSGPDAGQRVAAYYYFFFPNLMLNFYPWGLSLNIVEPIGLQECQVRFRTFIAEPSLADMAYNIDQVQREDEEVVYSVQKGIQSRFYQFGKFSPDHEKGVHHFHCQISAVLEHDFN